MGVKVTSNTEIQRSTAWFFGSRWMVFGLDNWGKTRWGRSVRPNSTWIRSIEKQRELEITGRHMPVLLNSGCPSESSAEFPRVDSWASSPLILIHWLSGGGWVICSLENMLWQMVLSMVWEQLRGGEFLTISTIPKEKLKLVYPVGIHSIHSYYWECPSSG